jgi:hypothetical protein
MTFLIRRLVVATALIAGVSAAPSRADVLGVEGSATALVVQLNGGNPIQTDFSHEIVPQTQPEPPVVASARLDRLLSDGSVTAAGQALAVFDRPAVLDQGTNNDAGLDLGAYSDDTVTEWLVDGAVSTVRFLQFSAADLDAQVTVGGVAQLRSRLLLSGVMLITAADSSRDLTGASVHFSFSVTLRQQGRPTTVLLSAEVNLVGGPNGTAELKNAAGDLAGVFLQIVDFTDQIPELPVVLALPFAGMNFPYTYEIIVGQPFELELAVQSEIVTLPDGVGAAAVFGAPQEGLASVLSRVKGDDRGRRLSEAIARRVDTTGQAYADTPVDAALPSATAVPMCGMMNLEAAGLLLVAGLVGVVHRRAHFLFRRRRSAVHRGG